MSNPSISFDMRSLTSAIKFTDGSILPSRFTATYAAGDDGLALVMDIAVDDLGRSRCVRLEVTATEDVAVTGEAVRARPLARLVRESTAAARSMFGRKVTKGKLTSMRVMPARAASGDYSTFAAEARTGRSGTPITTDNLKQVAKWHRAALKAGDVPAVAIAENASVSRQTAYRWIRSARDRGFIRNDE